MADSIEEQTARFLAGGGKIQQVPLGATNADFVGIAKASQKRAKAILGQKRSAATKRAKKVKP